MRISWNSMYSDYTWGVECDVCYKQGDPEHRNMFYFILAGSWGDWDICSIDCLHKFNKNTKPRWPQWEVIGGKNTVEYQEPRYTTIEPFNCVICKHKLPGYSTPVYWYEPNGVYMGRVCSKHKELPKGIHLGFPVKDDND